MTDKTEQQAALRKPFDPKEIGQLPRAGIKLDYVGHAAVTNRLLEVDPEWTWEPMGFTENGLPFIKVSGSEVVLWIKLTVCGVTRLGVGSVSSTARDPEKQLIGDAIRNAAMRFGVALDLWSKEELSHDDGPPAAKPAAKKPAAKKPAVDTDGVKAAFNELSPMMRDAAKTELTENGLWPSGSIDTAAKVSKAMDIIARHHTTEEVVTT